MFGPEFAIGDDRRTPSDRQADEDADTTDEGAEYVDTNEREEETYEAQQIRLHLLAALLHGIPERHPAVNDEKEWKEIERTDDDTGDDAEG